MIEKNEVNFFPRQEVFGLTIDKDDDGEAESLNTAQLLESTQRIKSDLKKINELLDEKLQNQWGNHKIRNVRIEWMWLLPITYLCNQW